jgi:hypothetical protein|tara:strand:- start:15390 stop:16247 length:858 start_codon:yes stop_codon:yes gene_type:complete
MATQTFTAFTPEVWSPRINFFFKTKLTAAPFFADYSDDVSDGGDIIHIPNVADSFTSITDIAVTTGTVTATNLSDTNTNLTVNKWKGVAYDLTDFQFAQVMKSFNIRNSYAVAMSHSLARQFDTDLLAEIDNITPSVGATGTALLATSVEKAFGILESNSIPKDECVLFIEPKVYWNNLMNITKYSQASLFGKPVIPKGAHDLFYGVPVVVTPQVPAAAGSGYTNAIVHRRAFVYAYAALPGGGKGVRLSEKPSEDLKVKIHADLAYGVKTLNATAGVKILASGA